MNLHINEHINYNLNNDNVNNVNNVNVSISNDVWE